MRGEFKFDSPFLLLVLLFLHILLQGRLKVVEVGIKRCESIGMIDIDHPAKAEGFDTDPGDVACSGGIYPLVDALGGSDIKSHMPVVGAELAKVSNNFGPEVEWPPEVAFGIIFIRCLGVDRKTTEKAYQDRKQKTLHDAKIIFLGRNVSANLKMGEFENLKMGVVLMRNAVRIVMSYESLVSGEKI